LKYFQLGVVFVCLGFNSLDLRFKRRSEGDQHERLESRTVALESRVELKSNPQQSTFGFSISKSNGTETTTSTRKTADR